MSTNDFMGSVRQTWRQRATEKTTLKDELRIVPRWLRTLILGLYITGLVIGEFMNYASSRGMIPGGMFAPDLGFALSELALAGLITLGALFVAVVLLLYGYIYADAKRRGMSPFLWLAVSIFVPYLIGVVIYFIVRDPLPFLCPRCGATVTTQFNFCSRCQLNLRPSCPQCRREIGSGDRFCRHCGAAIETGATVQPAPSGAPVPTL